MDDYARRRLEEAGFRETTVQELLGLSPAEAELIETRLALSRLIQKLRKERRLTQRQLAVLLESDQSKVSRAEQNEEGVSLEWMFRAAYALGADRTEVARALAA